MSEAKASVAAAGSGLTDLHRHLDGSLRPSTFAELAKAEGVEVPGDFGFSAGMGLSAALACFVSGIAAADLDASHFDFG